MPDSIKGFRYARKKHLLLQVKDWRQMISKFCVLLREADAHMNHRTSFQVDFADNKTDASKNFHI